MIFKVTDANPMRKLRKRASKGICEDEDEPRIAEEALVRKIIGKDELDVVQYDENFLYCPTMSQLPNIFSDIFGSQRPQGPSKDSSKKNKKTGELVFKVEEPKKILLYEPEDETKPVMMPVYKFHRKVSVCSKEGEEELDILPLVMYYQKCVDFDILAKRISNMIQEEWNKLHKDKRPAYVI